MKCILYRILGNDLSPWGSETQTEDNLKFILNHENNLQDCEKWFMLNRIADKKKEERLFDLIEKNHYGVHSIPFSEKDYRELKMYKDKIKYLTNVNMARNSCVKFGFGIENADYVLPFDGSSFFRIDGWSSFNTTAQINDEMYYAVGQWRISKYESALNIADQFVLKEDMKIGASRVIGMREPQIVFGKNADLRYNEEMLYGNCDRGELLWRLRIPGIWDRINPELRAKILSKHDEKFRPVRMVGWTARLPSGNPEADGDNEIREKCRNEGLADLVKRTDKSFLGS